MSNSNYYYCYLVKSYATPQSATSYIGFTNNPSKRIRAHNGEIKSGAWKTSKYRPWKYVCIVGGFPNKIVALQFEWQWQQNKRSRFYKLIHPEKATPSPKPKPTKEIRNEGEKAQQKKRNAKVTGSNRYSYKLKVLKELLLLPLWKQLNLTVYWVSSDLMSSMKTTFSSYSPSYRLCIISEDGIANLDTKQNIFPSVNEDTELSCVVCEATHRTKTKYWRCPQCSQSHHLLCTVRKYKETGESTSSLIPNEANCSFCHCQWKWNEIISRFLVKSKSDRLADEMEEDDAIQHVGEANGAENDEEVIFDEVAVEMNSDEDDHNDICSPLSQVTQATPPATQLTQTSSGKGSKEKNLSVPSPDGNFPIINLYDDDIEYLD
jgi:predicted GIY-YIG superfamily endonuclease